MDKENKPAAPVEQPILAKDAGKPAERLPHLDRFAKPSKPQPKPKPEVKAPPPAADAPPPLPPSPSKRYAVTLDAKPEDAGLLHSNLRRRVKAVTVDGKQIGEAKDFRLTGPAAAHRLSCTIAVEDLEAFQAALPKKAVKIGMLTVLQVDGPA